MCYLNRKLVEVVIETHNKLCRTLLSDNLAKEKLSFCETFPQ